MYLKRNKENKLLYIFTSYIFYFIFIFIFRASVVTRETVFVSVFILER